MHTIFLYDILQTTIRLNTVYSMFGALYDHNLYTCGWSFKTFVRLYLVYLLLLNESERHAWEDAHSRHHTHTKLIYKSPNFQILLLHGTPTLLDCYFWGACAMIRFWIPEANGINWVYAMQVTSKKLFFF